MTTGSVTPNCGRCRFFAEPWCRRFPPTVLMGARTWPRMGEQEWCGEFRPCRGPEEWGSDDGVILTPETAAMLASLVAGMDRRPGAVNTLLPKPRRRPKAKA